MIKSILLLFTFVLAFFVTTALTDFVDQHNDYYKEGIQESSEVGQ